ncbi:MAG: hypothetical protein IK122_00855 [Alphaproteobacteria bacterium]|nr:hypothetical protein [Alphaproteobacteria bacterium]MBR6502599.1 hypothetical protein [Clostridia bacterium]
MGIELFLIGVFFGLALGVVLGRLHRTNEEIELLDETERMRKIMKHQNLIITEQRIKLKRYKDGKVLLTYDDQRGRKA